MSEFISKITEVVRNAVHSVHQFVRTSPWGAAAAVAMIALLFRA